MLSVDEAAMAQTNVCHEAKEAMGRIASHEEICEVRYNQINSTMERIESSTLSAHGNLYLAISKINDNILRALIWAALLFGGAVVGLVVYIYLHPRGIIQ